MSSSFTSLGLLTGMVSSNKKIGMERPEELVHVLLSKDEAYELLTRCIQSEEEDTAVFRNALRRLARAIETKERDPIQLAA